MSRRGGENRGVSHTRSIGRVVQPVGSMYRSVRVSTEDDEKWKEAGRSMVVGRGGRWQWLVGGRAATGATP